MSRALLDAQTAALDRSLSREAETRNAAAAHIQRLRHDFEARIAAMLDAHAESLRVMHATHDDLRAERGRLAARVDTLTDELLRMKRAGYEPTPKEPTTEPAVELPQAVADAIRERALDPAMTRDLESFALAKLRDKDLDADAVAKMILDGEDVEELTIG